MSYTPWQTNGERNLKIPTPLERQKTSTQTTNFGGFQPFVFLGAVFIIAFLFVPNLAHATPPNDLIESIHPIWGGTKFMLDFFHGRKPLILLAKTLRWAEFSGFPIPTGQPSPDSQKTGFWFQCLSDELDKLFSFKDGESLWSYLNILTLATCRSWLLSAICLSASLTLTKRSWFCSSPVWHPNPTCETTLPKSSAQFHFVVKIYLGLLAAEHQCRVAAFDFAWWQSQFSDVFGCPGLMLSRACHV